MPMARGAPVAGADGFLLGAVAVCAVWAVSTALSATLRIGGRAPRSRPSGEAGGGGGLASWREPWVDGGAPAPGRVFLSVASFRDARCAGTVRDAFAKAARPDLLVVGLCEQNAHSAEACWGDLPVDRGEVRLCSVPAAEAAGPCVARARVALLWQGEPFFAQVDAHTRFCEGWDDAVREMISGRPEHRCVMSHYPPALEREEEGGGKDGSPAACDGDVPAMDTCAWVHDRMLMNECRTYAPKGHFVRSRGLGCGFLAAPGFVLREVPLDPTLSGLYQGEEVLWAARLYTHGYGLYSPPRNVVAHDYAEKDDGSPKLPMDTAAGEEHCWDMLRETYATPRARESRRRGYGFGARRSVAEFFRYLRVQRDGRWASEHFDVGAPIGVRKAAT